MKKIGLLLNSQCNENCPYCHAKLDNQSFNLDTLNKLDNLDNGCEFLLVGGEPGLLTEDQVVVLIEKIESKKPSKITVQTNGLFISKFYDIFSTKMDFIQHVISSSHSIYTQEKIDHYIVIDHSNIDDMILLIESNPTIVFCSTISWKLKSFNSTFMEKFRKILEYTNVNLDGFDKTIFLNNISLLPLLKNISLSKCLDKHIFIEMY